MILTCDVAQEFNSWILIRAEAMVPGKPGSGADTSSSIRALLQAVPDSQ
jgi:hypothetical protein